MPFGLQVSLVYELCPHVHLSWIVYYGYAPLSIESYCMILHLIVFFKIALFGLRLEKEESIVRPLINFVATLYRKFVGECFLLKLSCHYLLVLYLNIHQSGNLS